MTIVRVVRVLMPISSAEPQVRGWCSVNDGPVPLRCWWAPTGVETGAVGRAARNRNETDSYQERKRAVLVLPEVFGVNAWVRSVADRIAATGVPALAMPLFARTAPELDLTYGEMQLAEGRSHKSATTAAALLADGTAAISWLRRQLNDPQAEITVVGFCFGGHVALLMASLPEVARTFDFYGAGVVQGRPGGGAPTLDGLPQVQGELTCLFGLDDSLIPKADRDAIESALRQADPSGARLRCVSFPNADHGFMCDARAAYQPEAAAQGWQRLLGALRR